MADYLKVKATNTSGGPRIFNAASPILLQAGESTAGEVDITAAELASMRRFGEFAIDGDSDEAPKPVSLSGKNKAELLEIAEAERVPDVTGAMTNADITSAIELHREAHS